MRPLLRLLVWLVRLTRLTFEAVVVVVGLWMLVVFFFQFVRPPHWLAGVVETLRSGAAPILATVGSWIPIPDDALARWLPLIVIALLIVAAIVVAKLADATVDSLRRVVLRSTRAPAPSPPRTKPQSGHSDRPREDG